jgi:hypothetical protein
MADISNGRGGILNSVGMIRMHLRQSRTAEVIHGFEVKQIYPWSNHMRILNYEYLYVVRNKRVDD